MYRGRDGDGPDWGDLDDIERLALMARIDPARWGQRHSEETALIAEQDRRRALNG